MASFSDVMNGVIFADGENRLVLLNPAAEHLSGVEDRGRTLWTILSLQMWAEQWLTGARHAAPDASLAAVRAAAEAPLPARH